jgi:photosystem I subunit 3
MKKIISTFLNSFFTLFFGTAIFLTNIPSAHADFTNLTPCSESKAFQKRLTSSIKKLENRLKLYTPESKEAEFLTKEIEATKVRFTRYSSTNLLCGKEGLPRIIASGQWDHVNEFVLPGILFIYITGWIGWVGRKYLRYVSTLDNSFENEIIINVPIAISFMSSGFLWPVESWKEFSSGQLLANEDEITISPR